MTSLDNRLWGLISTHKMPDDASGRSFIDQLMAEHRISRETAAVAITEYQKFMYLCATRPERNVPSKAVDLVWHLHMQHSRDYWEVFCQKLGKPVHHTPGGQGSGHLEDYKATVGAYRSLFGPPPKGIWKLHNKVGTVAGLIFSAGFIYVGINAFALREDLWFGVFGVSVGLFLLVQTLNSLTATGEWTLIFENGDPFADGDAGDCGSGDGGGGCGD